MSVNIINGKLLRTWQDTGEIMPDGSAEFTLVQRVPWANIFQYVPQPLQPHPDFPALLYYGGSVQHEEGGMGNLVSRFRGIFSDNAAAFMQVDGQVSTTAEPLELAPVFNGNYISGSYDPDTAPVTRSDIAIVQNFLAGGSGIDPTTIDPKLSGDVARKYFNKKLRGQDSYYRPGFVHRRHYINNEVPEYTELVGTIVDPNDLLLAGAPDIAVAPTPPSGQNYLFSGLAYRIQGGVVTIDEEFILSGPGGWDIDLYTAFE